jgi:hypothetical protein
MPVYAINKLQVSVYGRNRKKKYLENLSLDGRVVLK